ncbi:7 transmembrane sweet-taste receptor of 3 GCPR-domain-containing protein [Dichotomocladium elegans]|nr:7 transmembrane sweet-taste receptor of 3 GCPR-domain-containing protein [Dichotomocladium elegans]
MATVITYRKREIFKASSPLFCILELLGFIFLYSTILFYMADRTKTVCVAIPITFHIGFSLVLANLIAKNYRIYRIFNNIFITKTVVTDMHLLRVSGTIVLIELTVLLSWLATSELVMIDVPLSRAVYHVQCAFQGPGSRAFSVMLTILPGIQLAVATFLAIKTRTVGKRYSKYSEYKQIGISVYNIFFSALIGFIIYSVPTADYFTHHYLTAFIVLWATTFTMLILFVPKLHCFFFREESSETPPSSSSSPSSSDTRKNRRSLPFDLTADRELVSINHMLASPTLLSPSKDNGDENLLSPLSMTMPFQKRMRPHSRVDEEEDKEQDLTMGIHEARVPVQIFLKWIPFVAAWDMKHVFLCPSIACFSIYSEKSHHGQVLGYTRASIVSCVPEAYIFKVHGKGFYDVLVQVGSQQELEQWCSWFNDQNAGSKSYANTNQRQTRSSSSGMTTTLATTTPPADDFSIDKSMLLVDRHQSSITLETMDSCINAPRVTENARSPFNLPSLQIPYLGTNHNSRQPNEPNDIRLHELFK